MDILLHLPIIGVRHGTLPGCHRRRMQEMSDFLNLPGKGRNWRLQERERRSSEDRRPKDESRRKEEVVVSAPAHDEARTHAETAVRNGR